MAESKTEARAATEKPASPLRQGLWLFLISFLILFFELACIRWFGSTVIFLTFFTNLVLMACFLGISVGCLAASRRFNLANLALPLALAAMVLAVEALRIYSTDARVTVDVGGQQSPQQIFFGTEDRPNDPSRYVVPIEAVAGVFFVLVSLIFVGLGQPMGRLFNAMPNRVAAYTINILGSLAGIGAFAAVSLLRLPPLVWFSVAAGLTLLFTTRLRLLQLGFAIGIVALMATTDRDRPGLSTTIWSPYYKVGRDLRSGDIYVNNILHQRMMPVGYGGVAYTLPYLLNKDVGRPPLEDVLIIGAGSGNDVAAALAMGAKHVDAVEIDPVLAGIGKEAHPNKPYADPRVTLHLDDGRSFIRKSDKQYDLVIYALVDSLVLHSGYSSLRLESYLFTEQAFRDIRARLKPDGVFAMYNYYRQGWVVGRLDETARRVFGSDPIVFSIPYSEQILPAESQIGSVGFVLIGPPGSATLEQIRARLQSEGAYWASGQLAAHQGVDAYGPQPPTPSGNWNRIGPARVVTEGIGRLPTDDLPFLYLRDPVIPRLNQRGMAVVAVLSMLILLTFAPARSARPSGRMFFLGAGFMLLETKGVVHMALLFGSTWVVNSIVFAAVLLMILLANLYVLAVRPRRLGVYYALLIAALLANVLVPMSQYLALPGLARVVVSCAVVFLPVFFAGVVFATSFRDSARPDVDFGWNIAGAILGGLTEFASLVVGFNALLAIAIAYYLLSALLGPRAKPAEAIPAGTT